MSKTVDDLVKVYIIAHFGADNGPRNRERYRAGIAAVVRALRDEVLQSPSLEDEGMVTVVDDIFDEILGEKAVTPGERQDTLCERCKEMIEPDDVAHIVEAFETTGKMLCAGCWGHYCEENEV